MLVGLWKQFISSDFYGHFRHQSGFEACAHDWLCAETAQPSSEKAERCKHLREMHALLAVSGWHQVFDMCKKVAHVLSWR